MKRLASLVLRHKLLVVLTWLTLAVAGFATISTTTHWMTATFALPGQPGYVTDTRIAALYHNGGGQTPTVLTLTVPALNQAAPLRSLPDSVTDLDHFRVQRRDRAGGVLHEYHLVTQVFGTHLPRQTMTPTTTATAPRQPHLLPSPEEVPRVDFPPRKADSRPRFSAQIRLSRAKATAGQSNG